MIRSSQPLRRQTRQAERLASSVEQIFQTISSLDIETLETRQMLSSTVLTSEQLVDTAMDYVRQHASDYGLTANDLNDYVLTDQYTTDHLGISHIYFRQKHEGLEIRDANLNVNIRLDGTFVSAGNRFISGIYDENLSVVPTLSAAQTLRKVIDEYEWTSSTFPLLISTANDRVRTSEFSTGDIAVQNIRANLEFVDVDGQLQLAWKFNIRRPFGEAWLDSSFSAVDGRPLQEADWIDHAIYNVFDRPLDGPLYGNQTYVVDPNDKITSPYGWHDLNGIPGIDTFDTSGNNVHAQLDRFATDSGTGARAYGGVNLEFLAAYNQGMQPVISADAATTNLYYWVNTLHDIHYEYGFDEAAGNFQENNYGNGGMGGDSVQADAQYGARFGYFNNAFFATPPDGETPQMAMLEWNLGYPYRDGDYENTIVTHEFGHGVSNRLTGGPSNADALNDIQSGGMGEGWSDWWSLMVNQVASDRANDAYPLGNWVLYDDFLMTPGIRRYPYSFDMMIDPLTLGYYNLSQEVHNAGEIWTSTLWDMNWLLINGQGPGSGQTPFPGHGFDSDIYHGTGGNNIALQLVMDALKLQPTNPSFLEARDAILLADQLDYNGANQLAIWTAFARRGMGFSAVDGGSRSHFVVEAFDLPNLSRGVVTLDANTYDVGDSIRIDLFDYDLVGAGSQTVSLESNSGDIENVILAETGGGYFRGFIDSAGGEFYFGNSRMELRGGDTITVTYNDLDDGTGGPSIATDSATINGSSGSFVTVKTYPATGVPLGLPSIGTINSNLTITDAIPIADLNVTVNISHARTAQLRLALIGPDGTRVALATNVGGNMGQNANFTNTIFDDEAAIPIGTGVNPFNGSYQPEQSLSAYDGKLSAGVWTLEITDTVAGTAGTLNAWSITITNANFSPVRFDFGQASQPVARTFKGVSTGKYSPTLGYGWVSGSTIPLTHAVGSRLTRDSVYTRDASFGVAVPDGIYEVTFYVGDTLQSRDQMGLSLEGVLMDSVTTTPGQVATRVFRSAVADGQLTIGLSDLGGATAIASVVGLEIRQVSETHFDFGTSISPVANGYVRATASLFNPNLGFGWQNDAISLSAVDRVIGTPLTRDLVLLNRGTFEAKVPSGQYTVSIRYGDLVARHDLMGVFIEGTYQGNVSTKNGQTVSVDYNVSVADGGLTVYFVDLGGGDEFVAVISLDINGSGAGSPAGATPPFGNVATLSNSGRSSPLSVELGSGRSPALRHGIGASWGCKQADCTIRRRFLVLLSGGHTRRVEVRYVNRVDRSQRPVAIIGEVGEGVTRSYRLAAIG